MFGVSAALQGYLFENMKWYERVVSAVGGLLLIYPGLVTDAIGLALIGIMIIVQIVEKKHKVKTLA